MNEPPAPRSEARQRWRVVVRRGAAARSLTHRDIESAWESGLARAGVPVALSGGARPRPRLVFGAPVPVGLTAEREPLDLFLAERLTIADLRARLVAALPPGHELVELHDVWVGAPSIAGLVVAADYRAELDADADDVDRATRSLLAADRLDRPGRKGDASRSYDLRPLIVDLAVSAAEPVGAVVRMRLRHQSEAGTGRPDEVILAVEQELGSAIAVLSMVRERLVLGVED